MKLLEVTIPGIMFSAVLVGITGAYIMLPILMATCFLLGGLATFAYAGRNSPAMISFRKFTWGAAHLKPYARDMFLIKTHTMFRFEWSNYWQEAEKYYSTLDVRNKIVIDVGADYGVTPMYFIRQGALRVYGYSLENAIFRYPGKHFVGPITGKKLVKIWPDGDNALKVDAEGLEWDLTPEWISKFGDWIICCHNPVRNEELHSWLKQNGKLIGRPNDIEFAIFQKI